MAILGSTRPRRGLFRQLRRVEDLLAEAAARPLIFRAVRRERGQDHRLQAFGEGQ